MLPVDGPYNLTGTMDLGAPISYLVLERGTDVFSSDDQPIGRGEHVLADDREDVFDGIVITRSGIGRGHVFADADEVCCIGSRDHRFEVGIADTVAHDVDHCARPADLSAKQVGHVAAFEQEKVGAPIQHPFQRAIESAAERAGTVDQ